MTSLEPHLYNKRNMGNSAFTGPLKPNLSQTIQLFDSFPILDKGNFRMFWIWWLEKNLSVSGLILTFVIPGSSSLTSSTNFAPSRWFSAAPGLSWLTGYWNGGPDSSAGAPVETPADPADDETEYDFFENRRVPDRQAHYLHQHIGGLGPLQ